MKELSLSEKKDLRDRIDAMQKASGLSGNRFAVERLGFTGGSKYNHVINNWDKPGMVGTGTWDVIERYIEANTRYKGVRTANLEKVWNSCERAYTLKKPMAVIGEGGLGKTFALEKYKEHAEAHKRKVVYFDASMIRTNKQFIAGLMKALDCYKAGTISTQLAEMRNHVNKNNLLLIIDEVSSMEGHNVVIIKDIITAFKDLCGIVFAGTPYFINNLNRGANRDRHLFSETRDRLFMLPERLEKPTEAEAEAIFTANGITGEQLNIVMGRNPKLLSRSYKAKQTFRGIKDCIDMMNMLEIRADFSNITL